MTNFGMNKTYRELVRVARAENIHIRTNKRTLTERIEHYRNTVGTLHRETKKDL